MVDLGVLKPTVQSLSSNVDKERESAASLLYELSLHPRICERVGSEKGAILILVGVTSNNSGNVGIRGLAEQTLTNLEQFDSTIVQMAEAGRLKPLLTRLCEGTNHSFLLDTLSCLSLSVSPLLQGCALVGSQCSKVFFSGSL